MSKEKREKLLKEKIKEIENLGIKVRREVLKSGRGYRIKSGSCYVESEKTLFIDKALSTDQQLNLLNDSQVEIKQKLEEAKSE